MEDTYEAKDVYDFFKELLGKSGMNKSMGSLFVEWNVPKDNRETALLNREIHEYRMERCFQNYPFCL